MSIRLLIAEDHPWIREGLRAALASTEIEVVGEVATGAEAICAALAADFDIMLLDVKMPACDGFEVLERVKSARPDLPVLVYSHHVRWDLQERARRLAASGYVAKTADKDELVDAIRRASRGENLWSRSEDSHPSLVTTDH